MADQQGRCKNIEFCSNAVSGKIISVPEGASLECPKCGEPLEALVVAKRAQRNRSLLFIQVIVIIGAAGGLGYKLLGTLGGAGAPKPVAAQAAPPANAPLAGPAELAASGIQPPAGSDSPSPAPADTAAPTPPPPAAAPPAPQAVASAPAATMLLHMAGSDVVASRLARRLASGYLALIGDTDIVLAQGPGAGAVSITGNSAGEREGIAIAGGASASGVAALLRGGADIAMTTRPVTPAEIEQLAAVGDMTSAGNEHVIAVEGIAAVVSPANRLPSIGVAQLRDILTGKLTNWSQLGAPAAPIHVIAQAADEADTGADFVLQGGKLAATATRVAGAEAVAAGVAADRDAIGLVPLARAGTARMLPISAGTAAPVAPTDLAVSTEDYPLTRRIYFYTGAGNNNFVRRFSDYVASPSGQAAVAAAGFVPLTVKAAVAALPATATGRYRALVGTAARLNVDFRFQPGSTELDSRGVRDLDRLITYMRSEHASGGRLILAGFADKSGTPAANQAVAERRAQAVAAALAAAGMAPQHVAAFGADLPVADDATAEGRERNRRVEVFLGSQ